MIKNTKVKYTLTVYKKKQKINTFKMSVLGTTSLNDVTDSILNEIEIIVINNSWVTIFAGVFGLLTLSGSTKPIAMITYRPSFNYNKIFTDKAIYQELQLIAPGFKI